MRNNEKPARTLALIAAFPDRKDVLKAATTLRERGYQVDVHSPVSDYCLVEPRYDAVVLYVPTMVAAQINKAKLGASAAGFRCYEIRAESSSWKLPPLPIEGEKVEVEAPVSKAKPSVDPGDLDAFFSQVRKGLQEELGWGEIVQTVQPWWNGSTLEADTLRQYVERTLTLPERCPPFFREFWRSWTDPRKKEPVEEPEKTPELEVLKEPLSDSELQSLYAEAERTNEELQAANSRLTKLQEELAGQLRQEQSATDSARRRAAEHYRALLACRREVDQHRADADHLRSEVGRLSGELATAGTALSQKTAEAQALTAALNEMSQQKERLQNEAQRAVTPAHKILTLEGFATIWQAHQLRVVSAEELLRRVAEELGLLRS